MTAAVSDERGNSGELPRGNSGELLPERGKSEIASKGMKQSLFEFSKPTVPASVETRLGARAESAIASKGREAMAFGAKGSTVRVSVSCRSAAERSLRSDQMQEKVLRANALRGTSKKA